MYNLLRLIPYKSGGNPVVLSFISILAFSPRARAFINAAAASQELDSSWKQNAHTSSLSLSLSITLRRLSSRERCSRAPISPAEPGVTMTNGSLAKADSSEEIGIEAIGLEARLGANCLSKSIDHPRCQLLLCPRSLCCGEKGDLGW